MQRLSKQQLFLFIGAILLGVILCNFYLGLALYVGKAANLDTKKQSDVILVLGAKAYHGKHYNPCLVARVTHAVQLYHEQYAPYMLLSGGDDKEDGVNEAEIMQRLAVHSGVPLTHILLEKTSTSTYENLVNSQKLLQAKHLHSVLLVTEPFHQARASLVAEQLGLSYTVSPASESQCWVPWKYLTPAFLREPIAILTYVMEGKISIHR